MARFFPLALNPTSYLMYQCTAGRTGRSRPESETISDRTVTFGTVDVASSHQTNCPCIDRCSIAIFRISEKMPELTCSYLQLSTFLLEPFFAFFCNESHTMIVSFIANGLCSTLDVEPLSGRIDVCSICHVSYTYEYMRKMKIE